MFQQCLEGMELDFSECYKFKTQEQRQQKINTLITIELSRNCSRTETTSQHSASVIEFLTVICLRSMH